MRRALPLVLLLAALAGCGGSKQPASRPPDPAATLRALIRGSAHPLALLTPASRKHVTASELNEGVEAFVDTAPVHVLHAGGDWAVAWTDAKHAAEGTTEVSAYAVAERLSGGTWLAEIAGPVAITALGPQPRGTAASIPQVAFQIKAPKPIVDTSLWVDGKPIDTKGGGPSSTYISMYGAPATPLRKGRHVAVAFARAGPNASALAWWFTVR